MPHDPHPDFTRALRAANTAAANAGCHAPRFLEAINQRCNGVAYSSELALDPRPAEGFTTFHLNGLLCYTAEAHIISASWHTLFTPDVLLAAYNRLGGCGYQFPPDSWRPSI